MKFFLSNRIKIAFHGLIFFFKLVEVGDHNTKGNPILLKIYNYLFADFLM